MGATYDDLVRLDLPKWQIGEILSGELFVRRSPPVIGAYADTVLLAELRDVALNGPWWVLPRHSRRRA